MTREGRSVMMGIVTLGIVHVVLVNVPLLLWDPAASVFRSLWNYFHFVAYDDSWAIMNHALEYLHIPAIREMFHDQPIYQVIFFDQHVKFLYPLTSLLFFEPIRLAQGTIVVEDSILNIFSWLAVAVSVGLILRRQERLLSLSPTQGSETPRRELALVAAGVILGLSYFPLQDGFMLGQVQTWIDVLVALAVLAWIQDSRVAAGVLIGLASLIKPQFLLFLPWSLIRRDWHFMKSQAATVACLGALAVAVYGWSNNLGYLEVLRYVSMRGETTYANQSVNGLLNRAFFNGENLRWDEHQYPPFQPVVYGVTLLTSILLAASALLSKSGSNDKNLSALDLGIAGFSFTLASPIVWWHHYGVLLPLYAMILPIALRSTDILIRRLGSALLALSFILTANNFDFLNYTAASRLNFMQSYSLFGALIGLGVMYWMRQVHRRQPFKQPALTVSQ